MFLSTLFPNTISLGSSMNVRDQVWYPYKITVLNILAFVFLDRRMDDNRFCTKGLQRIYATQKYREYWRIPETTGSFSKALHIRMGASWMGARGGKRTPIQYFFFTSEYFWLRSWARATKNDWGESDRKECTFVEIKCQLNATEVFYCRSYCLLRVMCPVCRMLQHPANRTHNPQLHTRPATWKPQHEIPQAATSV